MHLIISDLAIFVIVFGFGYFTGRILAIVMHYRIKARRKRDKLKGRE